VPALRLPPGIVNEVVPPERDCADDVYTPLESVTVPVGVVPPDGELATVTVTARLWLEAMLFCPGATLTVVLPAPTVAVQAFTTLATFSDPSPVARS
jgi:hypothetical protein